MISIAFRLARHTDANYRAALACSITAASIVLLMQIAAI